MPHNPASIVRLLYGERAAEQKTALKRFPFHPANNSLTSTPPIAQGRRSDGSVLKSRWPRTGSVPNGALLGSAQAWRNLLRSIGGHNAARCAVGQC